MHSYWLIQHGDSAWRAYRAFSGVIGQSLSMLGAIAQFEREIRAERQVEWDPKSQREGRALRPEKDTDQGADRQTAAQTRAGRPHQNVGEKLPPLQSECVSLPQWSRLLSITNERVFLEYTFWRGWAKTPIMDQRGHLNRKLRF